MIVIRLYKLGGYDFIVYFIKNKNNFRNVLELYLFNLIMILLFVKNMCFLFFSLKCVMRIVILLIFEGLMIFS